MKNKLDELAIQIESTQDKLQELISEYEEMKGNGDVVFLSLYKLSGDDGVYCSINGRGTDIANCLLSTDELNVILNLITAYKNFRREK